MNLNARWSATLFSALLLTLLFVTPADAGILPTNGGDGIGVYGDSISMQYQAWIPYASALGYPITYNPNSMANWVNILRANGYNFGGNITEPAFLGINTTFARYDRAVAGATTANLASQVSKLTPYIAAGQVKLTVLGMGGNDFVGEYGTIYDKAADPLFDPLADPDTQTFMDTIFNRISTAVTSTLTTDPAQRMILMTIPDIGATPQVTNFYGDATQRADVTTVVSAINHRIIDLAASYHMPVVDLQSLTNLVQAPPTVAGITLLPTGGNSSVNMFLSDGFHPGTIINGLLANAVLYANNLAYNDPVTYISDQAIVTRAGLTPSGPSPTFYNVAPLVIFSPVPEPSTFVLSTVGLLGLGIAARRKNRRVA